MARSSFDVLAELFARDIDTELLERSQRRTFVQRLQWLEEMQAMAVAAKKAHQK